MDRQLQNIISKKIANDGYNLWRMLPGKGSENYPYEREFLESNTIGIGWGRIGNDVIEKNMTKEADGGTIS